MLKIYAQVLKVWWGTILFANQNSLLTKLGDLPTMNQI